MKKILSLILGLMWVLPVWGALPSGYTQLQYIESTGTQYIDTGVSSSDGNDTIRINIDIQSVETDESNHRAFGRFANGANYVYDAGGVWGNGVENSRTSSRQKTNIDAIFKLRTLNMVFNGTDTLNRNNGYESPGSKFQLFGIDGAELGKFKIWDAKIWKNDELVRDFIPAKNSSGVVGMYDTVGNRFYTNAGTGEFIAGPVALDTCRNLFDKDIADANRIYGFFQQTGTSWTWAQNGFSVRIPCKPNTTYTARYNGNDTQTVLGFGSTNNDDIPPSGTSVSVTQGIRQTNPTINTPVTLTTGPNDKWLIVAYNVAEPQHSDMANNLQIEEGDTATAYVPYCEKIKIATTKYNETAFGPLNTALQNAISVVDTVVSNTITQAASIATLQAQKQTRPNDIADDNEKCPAGKKCLLVEDASGTPHWYEIVTGRLPDGYTELEYIESTGTQYIDTNVLVTDDISWEGRFLSKNDTSKAASIFGYRWTETPTAQGNMRFVFIYPDGTFAVRFGVDASRTNLVMSGAETVTLKCEKDKFYANGSLFYTETRKNNEGEPQSGYLFNVNALNTVDISPVKMKLYYFKMWDDGTLVRDFVPALNPDGKIGMYDTVNGVFYENAGTGTFIGGQPVFN